MIYEVVIFGNKETTEKMIRFIHLELIPVNLIITLKNDALQNQISGYKDLTKLSNEIGIPCFEVSDYKLTDNKSLEFFYQNTFKIGISIGWQRIIPEQILDKFCNGIFGFHGSAGHLPYGRGRSPLNWSIIKGHKRFINNCFKYNAKADEGSIHSIKVFEINEFDTIQTLQYKSFLVGKEQISNLIHDYLDNSITLRPQVSNKKSWYPKRSAKDGRISLNSSTLEIYNLIRAVTHPFPGAYLFTSNGSKIIIWEAYPFDYFLDTINNKVGEVIEIFKKDMIVKTIDGSLIIKNYETDDKINAKDILY